MSRPPTDLPERLLAADATDFERRVLEAALCNRPSPAASARMARALGVTASVAATTAATAAKVADAAAAKATASAGATAVWPWVSVGVLGLVVAGALVGARAWRASPHDARSAARSAERTPAPSLIPARPPAPPAGATSPPAAEIAAPAAPVPAAPSHRGRGAGGSGDVRDEIALLDAARQALSSGADRRGLELLRRYGDRYPSGSLRPEATAIKIEALMKLDRDAEARALAARFIAEHRGSLLAGRVAELVGLTQPPAAP